MKPPTVQLSHITLWVRDLHESASFYLGMFGLERLPADPPSARSCICRSRAEDDGQATSLQLIEGLPPGVELLGLDHFGLEVPSAEDVFLLYRRARERRLRVTRPRNEAGRWRAFIFDPDGYKVEVKAAAKGGCESLGLVLAPWSEELDT